MYVGYFIHSFVHFPSLFLILAAFFLIHLFGYRQQAFKLHSIVVVWSWLHTVPLSSSTDKITFVVQNLSMHFCLNLGCIRISNVNNNSEKLETRNTKILWARTRSKTLFRAMLIDLANNIFINYVK